MYKIHEPNWEFWCKPGIRVRLWEGICLFVNIEPPRPFGHEIGHLFELKNLPKKFQEGWEFLNRDENFSKLNEVGTAGRMLHRINLDGFAHWAMCKGFDLPVQLQKIAVQFKLLNEESTPQLDRPTPQKLLDVPLRVEPQGGDALTPVIWGICYDMRDAGKEIKPRHVMSKLRELAENKIWPLVGVVQGGVKFEFEKGEEDELDSDALRKRINKWKAIATGT